MAPDRPTRDLRRAIPSLDRLLSRPGLEDLQRYYGRELVRDEARAALETLRESLASTAADAGPSLEAWLRDLPARLARRLDRRLGGRLQRVLNLTGIFLHTNLGRAPLPREVACALPRLLDAYCDLETDLDTGRRGDRNRRAARLLEILTGAEAALVVNNNAAALALVLATLARDREVVVSRGELVEIGGSFRIPDILTAAGARLREVGTTNRTRLDDYRRALGSDTALLLKVHPSNYRMRGFVASVEAGKLAGLAQEAGVPLLVDEGSGMLRAHSAPQLRDHPSLSALLGAGCDLVCGSGDKLLGGPQAGLLLGRAGLVERCRTHPLYRAFRPDRATFAALEAVLRLHLAGGRLPIDRLWGDPAEHRRRLERIAAALGAEIVPAEAFVGGGAAPDAPIPGEALALPGDDSLVRRLRAGTPPVVAYLRDGRLLLDLRTLDPADDEKMLAAVRAALADPV